MRTGYAAFLDIMGFSAIVAGEGHADRINGYLACLREALDGKGRPPRIEYVVFSDSIVITTADDTEASLQGVWKAVRRSSGRCSIEK